MRVLGPSMRSFFFNDTATTEIYTLSLHDALPIFADRRRRGRRDAGRGLPRHGRAAWPAPGLGEPAVCPADRKSTRLNSSHANISYAVFCLKKKDRRLDVVPSKIFHPLTFLAPIAS